MANAKSSRRTRERIPAHLRRFVVEQDYAAYDEIDQAVWRFVLLQTYARLSSSAHPAYARGLRRTGISTDRIPRIDEMDACLGEYGWGAVAVGGFIPPRAFQAFQALGILPIAAEIRSSDQLAYTPAPDIVHEAAGHAPILPDPSYRAFLQRIGEVGSMAFSKPLDRALDSAIRALSEIKNDPAATQDSVAGALRNLERVQASVGEPSEAALLARLHWWTVEYGLVGPPDDYRIYGAGLLSSLGESHFCHDPSVEKRRLDLGCIETAYDITSPQPQLFVAEDFDHLQQVLSELAAQFAQSGGADSAVARALESEELATLELSGGLWITGVLTAVSGGPTACEYLRFTGPCALGCGDAIWPEHDTDAHPDGYATPVGRLADGRALSELCERDLDRFAVGSGRARLRVRYASGIELNGELVRVRCAPDGRLALLRFENCSVTQRGELLFDPAWGHYDLAAAEAVVSARAGPADPGYWHAADAAFPDVRCPRRSARCGDEAALLDLYREALALWESPESAELVERFEAIDAVLRERFPDRWLLRWNLLECLCKVSRGPELAAKLREELLATEARRPDQLPISMGLRHLDEMTRNA